MSYKRTLRNAKKEKKKIVTMLSAHSVPSIILSILNVLSHGILTTLYDYHHFTDGESEAQRD